MPQLTIESNGMIEKTAVYLNGEQLSGIKELFLDLDEEGTYNAVIQYEGKDKQIHTKQIFSDFLDEIKITEASFTEEESMQLEKLEVSSDGYIDETILWWNDDELEGVVSMFIHIKAPKNKSKGIKSLFRKDESDGDEAVCKAEITFRNEDDSIETEIVF